MNIKSVFLLTVAFASGWFCDRAFAAKALVLQYEVSHVRNTDQRFCKKK